jgi:hypothetical protein
LRAIHSQIELGSRSRTPSTIGQPARHFSINGPISSGGS